MQKINMLECYRKKSRIRRVISVCVWRWVIKLNREVTIGGVEMVTFDQRLERQGVSLIANSRARVTGAE